MHWGRNISVVGKEFYLGVDFSGLVSVGCILKEINGNKSGNTTLENRHRLCLEIHLFYTRLETGRGEDNPGKCGHFMGIFKDGAGTLGSECDSQGVVSPPSSQRRVGHNPRRVWNV